VLNIHGEANMPIVARLDELGKPAWIALMILGFFVWWRLALPPWHSSSGADE
jgi:hypothetical protein